MALHHDLINLFHLARTALSGTKHDPIDRMIWAAKQFHISNPEISENRAYKELSRMRDNAAYVPTFSVNPAQIERRSVT